MSGFWRNWFAVFSLSIGLFGAVLAGGAFEATSGPVRWILASLNGTADAPFDSTLRFSLGVMGAVSIGCQADDISEGITYLPRASDTL